MKFFNVTFWIWVIQLIVMLVLVIASSYCIALVVPYPLSVIVGFAVGMVIGLIFYFQKHSNAL